MWRSCVQIFVVHLLVMVVAFELTMGSHVSGVFMFVMPYILCKPIS